MYHEIIVLCMVLIIVYIIIYPRKVYENFYDIVPYNINWDIYKCLKGDCVIKKSYDCYKYCANIADSIAKQHCEMECLNIGDEMFDFLKYQNYNWPLNDSNKYFKNYSILNDNGDFVNVYKNIVN
jgi:hypothetical protein